MTIFKPEKNETAVIYCLFGTIKCQHCVTHMANPPQFQQRELKATDIKHVLTFVRLSLPLHKTWKQWVKISSHYWWQSIMQFHHRYSL